ncbi:hypothetical protein OVY01_04020 [Robbsia sp. Bb-Pol-6]|uniref:Uncharacterized protein n=1 Tax=Robbsia betulipollinis TaxID=2981849 RepID=A0ABT3ZIQ8_9BURK|nr:hypothetical protein [Robbsia betulipollinis]MCY0386419.1 hypothetical protein [Robbsia betulipollinis]
MSRSLRIALAIGALSAAATALPVQAQLHGDWPSDTPWSTAVDSTSAHVEHGGARPSPASLGAPRGDLRRDVAEASRGLPPHRNP